MGEAGCAKCLLICVNLAITLIGLGFFLSGVILRFAADVVEDYIDLESLAKRIPDFAEAVGMVGVDDGKVEKGVEEFTGFEVIGLVLLIVGLFVLITGLLGMCGACCTNKCMLVTYIVIVLIGVLVQLALVIFFATNTYVEQTRDFFKDSLEKNYKGIDSYELQSMLWNYIMLGYGCCGLDGGKDFEDAKKWNNVREFDIYGNGTGVEHELDYPVACCKTKGSFPGKLKPKNGSCAMMPTKDNNNYKEGCWEMLEKDIKADVVVFAAVVGVFLFLQIVCAILAMCILAKNVKSKSDQYA